jgi:hypothetical protein
MPSDLGAREAAAALLVSPPCGGARRIAYVNVSIVSKQITPI